MGTLFVVALQPFVADLANLLQGFKHVGVQNFRPIGPILSFDKRILIRFPRFNVSEFDGPPDTPRHQALGDVFWPVVEPNDLRLAPPGHHVLQHADHALRRGRGINFDRQALPHTLIKNIQGPKPSVAPYRVSLIKSSATPRSAAG